ncbi:Bax inhibitor-1/YccA family membrane protein [Georgenia sp. SUBG003]|uniref:Bax inhibitor-1/YccA family protein n=1 Tax=Georgenia sp. SUBG003 TaxID=1497974 RepID=UPI0004D4B461|nr:membrane protein [Georgenia sp. SUBG003]
MSNPVFEKSPYFGANAQRTPNGYPTYPGYAPQQGYGQAPHGQAPYGQPGHGQPAGYGAYQPGQVEDLERAYQRPAAAPADTGRMTYDDVIVKTGLVLGVIVVAAAFNWLVMGASPLLTFGGAIVGLVLGLVNAFKREPSPALIMAYAVAEGLFLGGISAVFEAQWGGIVLQAVLGTTATFVAALFLFKSGTVRVTPKLTRFVLIALVGYALFSLVNVVLMLTGVSTDPWGLRTGVTLFGIPLGVLLGLFAVGLAAICLIMDFDAIKRGVEAGVPGRYAWAAAFGLAVTLVWLYIEFLRLLAILRGSD